ncbi:MAG TPA: PHP domain-containing protein, partial [Vicinamibacterales bacterium]|nr:PHP domain-containing protein [Vicinamibacterales bacterium]
MTAYIELHTSSAFSFLRSASLPEVLIDRAAMLGYPAVALLDRDGVSGAPRFHKAALAAGIRPLIGAEITIETGSQVARASGSQGVRSSGRHAPGPKSQAHTFTLPVLCASQDGWRNLCRLL